MTPFETVRRLEASLASSGLKDARIEAETLVMHALGLNRTALYTAWRHDIVSAEQGRYIADLAGRRSRQEPLAYILGHREFYGLDLLVDERVLIPRPETEMLVDLALEAARSIDVEGEVTIADVGTGSGAIAVALAVNLPKAAVWATDLSEDALEVAAANARRHSVERRIRLIRGDLLAALPSQVDILISNPPYVPQDILPALEPEVLREPPLALAGGARGLAVIERLLAQAPPRLTAKGVMLMEFSPEQTEQVMHLAQRAFADAQADVIQDLAGLDRVLRVWSVAPYPPVGQGTDIASLAVANYRGGPQGSCYKTRQANLEVPKVVE